MAKWQTIFCLVGIFNNLLFESKTKTLYSFKVGQFGICEKHGCPPPLKRIIPQENPLFGMIAKSTYLPKYIFFHENWHCPNAKMFKENGINGIAYKVGFMSVIIFFSGFRSKPKWNRNEQKKKIFAFQINISFSVWGLERNLVSSCFLKLFPCQITVFVIGWFVLKGGGQPHFAQNENLLTWNVYNFFCFCFKLKIKKN